MLTVNYSESGPQPAAKIIVLSFILQTRTLLSGIDGGVVGNIDSTISLKAVTSVYNSIS